MPTRSSPMLQSYSEFLASSFGNFTQTYFADHSELWSHDQINRQLRSQKWTPMSLRQYLRNQIQFSHQGYLLFDDTVLDKRHSHFIEMLRRQWSGNAHAGIPGIRVVTCVYVNPELQRFWVLDFRLFDPERDGRSKIDHLLEMFDRVLQSCASSIRVVLMDSWYASMKVIKAIEEAHKVYYCPLKRNRQATQGPEIPYQRLDTLPFDESEEQSGKIVHLKKFPKGHPSGQTVPVGFLYRRHGMDRHQRSFGSFCLRSPKADSGALEGRAVSSPMETKHRSSMVSMPKTKSPTQSHHVLSAGLGPSPSGSNAGQNNRLRPQTGIAV